MDATEDYEQFSQEIRLTSPLGLTFEYIAGMYYHDADLYYRSKESFGTAAFGAPNVTRDYDFDQTQELLAVFGSLTWNISDRFRATLGLRYSDEEKVVSRTLDKRFTGGWDFSSAVGAPAGTFAYGNTAAEYDRFEQELAPVAAAVDAGVWGDTGFLGTYEQNFQNRKRSEDFVDWYLNAEFDVGFLEHERCCTPPRPPGSRAAVSTRAFSRNRSGRVLTSSNTRRKRLSPWRSGSRPRCSMAPCD